MSDASDLSHLAAQWASKADNDLRNAEYTLTLEEDCPFDTVCFHAQQTAEKYLKALLVWAAIDPPRTHDLRLLLQRIPSAYAGAFHMEDMVALNRYSVESRYPGDWEPITRAEAERSVTMATRIRAAVRQILVG